MGNPTEIAVVIPHFNGIDILRDCLTALYKNTFTDFKTILIDNGSTDGSQEWVRSAFPQVHLVENRENRGYAGGCNQGISLAESPFVLLLNNDTVMPENFLSVLHRAISQDDRIAAVQPKILSIQDPSRFDYSGAAGGELDIFGYPFARGRIFEQVEKDENQYDGLSQDVFWTSGCAMLLRTSVTAVIGVLDEDFFAHQEEIDWNWRAQLAGFRNLVATETYILHYSGYTLRSDNEKKMYLNHRNNLVMMIKNYSMVWLVILLPLRILMEMATIIADLVLWEGKRAGAVWKALRYLFSHYGKLMAKHRAIQSLRTTPDRVIMKNMFRGSIVWWHYIHKRMPVTCVKKYRKPVA